MRRLLWVAALSAVVMWSWPLSWPWGDDDETRAPAHAPRPDAPGSASPPVGGDPERASGGAVTSSPFGTAAWGGTVAVLAEEPAPSRNESVTATTPPAVAAPQPAGDNAPGVGLELPPEEAAE